MLADPSRENSHPYLGAEAVRVSWTERLDGGLVLAFLE
jgi:hypothetical protein